MGDKRFYYIIVITSDVRSGSLALDKRRYILLELAAMPSRRFARIGLQFGRVFCTGILGEGTEDE